MLHVWNTQVHPLLTSKSNPRMPVLVSLFGKRLHWFQMLWRKAGGLGNQIKLLLFILFETTGHRPPLRVALGLDCWRMWEGDEKPFLKIYSFFKIEGWGIFQSIELSSQCARFLDQRDSVEYRCLPQQSMFRWILRFNFCTFFCSLLFFLLLINYHQCLSRVVNGGHATSRSLINLNPGFTFEEENPCKTTGRKLKKRIFCKTNGLTKTG